MDKRIGAQYYTIRDFCQTLEDFDASCKKIREIGYQTVQLSGIGDFPGDEVKKVLEKYQLTAVCTHRNPNSYLEHLDKEIEYHKAIGCKIAGIGSMPKFNAAPETIEEFVQNYRPVAEELAKHDIILAYHNHSFEFEKINGEYAFHILLNKMNSNNFKLILDVYWLAYAGIDPAKFIREHAGIIACVHLKDLKIVNNAPNYAEIGQGNLDWDNILSACEEAGVSYALVEQDTCDGDPFESLKISYQYLHQRGFC